MVSSDPDGNGGAPDVSELFCHYNSLYFRDSLGSCAVSWTEDPLPDCDVSTCDYYPGGGGCIILLSKSLCGSHNGSDLKNALLHEMIHAYICIKDNNSNHSDHGAKFQKLMNTINLSSVADPHRPVDGYSITLLHEIHKKYYHYKCQSCADFIKSTNMRGPSGDDCIERKGVDDPCHNSNCHWHRYGYALHLIDCNIWSFLSTLSKVEQLRYNNETNVKQWLSNILSTVLSPRSGEDIYRVLLLSPKCGMPSRRGLRHYSCDPRPGLACSIGGLRTPPMARSLSWPSRPMSRGCGRRRQSTSKGLSHDGQSLQPSLRPSMIPSLVGGQWPGQEHTACCAVTWAICGLEVYLMAAICFNKFRNLIIHKQQCSGNYCRVQESSPGGPELKCLEAVEAFNEGKVEEPACTSWHTTHTSNKSRRSNKNEREDASVEFLHVAHNAVVCSGLDSSSKDSESDEDEVPLINKRTERRRRQRLHEMYLARESNDVEFGSSTSHKVGSCSLAPKDNNKGESVPASQPEERSCSSHPVSSNGVAGNQAGHEHMSSPTDSPIRGEIVDISDG
ncbi:hypothetical protein ZEAMMB73_Zm00001d028237 [Zea mays]|uniref:SprT-like domain-containing protein n=1 Tax=Zea mays TaxID=4577 RepID=A0A1D6JTF3_MAIZE|nr:hypothetical protein ZEAMMB73_Zm00001d028237 [Zea mays]